MTALDDESIRLASTQHYGVKDSSRREIEHTEIDEESDDSLLTVESIAGNQTSRTGRGRGKIGKRTTSRSNDMKEDNAEAGPSQSREEEQPLKKRTRNPGNPLKRGNACLMCRAKKLKCSATRPTCAQCARRNDRCVYDAHRPATRVEKLEEKLAEMDRINKMYTSRRFSADSGYPSYLPPDPNLDPELHHLVDFPVLPPAQAQSHSQHQQQQQFLPNTSSLASVSVPERPDDEVMIGMEGQFPEESIHDFSNHIRSASLPNIDMEPLINSSGDDRVLMPWITPWSFSSNNQSLDQPHQSSQTAQPIQANHPNMPHLSNQSVSQSNLSGSIDESIISHNVLSAQIAQAKHIHNPWSIPLPTNTPSTISLRVSSPLTVPVLTQPLPPHPSLPSKSPILNSTTTTNSSSNTTSKKSSLVSPSIVSNMDMPPPPKKFHASPISIIPPYSITSDPNSRPSTTTSADSSGWTNNHQVGPAGINEFSSLALEGEWDIDQLASSLGLDLDHVEMDYSGKKVYDKLGDEVISSQKMDKKGSGKMGIQEKDLSQSARDYLLDIFLAQPKTQCSISPYPSTTLKSRLSLSVSEQPHPALMFAIYASGASSSYIPIIRTLSDPLLDFAQMHYRKGVRDKDRVMDIIWAGFVISEELICKRRELEGYLMAAQTVALLYACNLHKIPTDMTEEEWSKPNDKIWPILGPPKSSAEYQRRINLYRCVCFMDSKIVKRGYEPLISASIHRDNLKTEANVKENVEVGVGCTDSKS